VDKAKLDLDGYQVVRGFLDPTLCELLAHTVSLMRLNLECREVYATASRGRRLDPDAGAQKVLREAYWDGLLPGEDKQVSKSYAWYGNPVMDSMLALSGPFIGKLIDKQLFPTYSYCRLYERGAKLPEHVDRAECQYSATLALGGDPWPIFMGGTQIDLAHGDMVVYIGCQLPHSREEFKGDGCTQLFLHYGDASNPIATPFEGRSALGLPPYVSASTLDQILRANQQSTDHLQAILNLTKRNSKED
jgi:hypothetical protein